MAVQEWFWVMKFKADQIEAEREAMEEASTGKRKIRVPRGVWKELHENPVQRQADDGG